MPVKQRFEEQDMEEKSVECEKVVDDVLLPGFRFHPTDEELVGFYLKRKVQQKSLPIELIKQVDIYKHDPWDLPSLATTGEKEWYFYCPRDRKYRNSARPNRVTGSGFWKATGTDRPIYSSDGSNCIGLKKSLVFYRGRAAKGTKTDWMMHEFRLPSLSEALPPKKFLDKSLPPNDAWAICRIFKKTNSMAQRAFTNSWMSPSPESIAHRVAHYSQFSSENISGTSEIGSIIQLNSNNNVQASSFSALDIPSYKPFNDPTSAAAYKPSSQFPAWNGDMMFAEATECSVDPPCMITNHNLFGEFNKGSESIHFENSQQQQLNAFSVNLSQDMQGGAHIGLGVGTEKERKKLLTVNEENNQWGQIQSIGFPFSLPDNAWKSIFQWEPESCPSEISTTFSTNKCYPPSDN